MTRLLPLRALVLDDEEAVGRRLGEWLRIAACDAVTFTEPAAALAHVAQAPPHLAFVDLRLPGLAGAEVIAQLRIRAPGVRIIALCGFPETAEVITAVRAGARDVLEKPVQQPALLAAVERALAEDGLHIRTEEEFNQRLGARLRLLRSETQRTLADVAGAADLTAAQLSQIENGRSGTTAWGLARICGALRLPLDTALRGL
ncbi:MAG: response regulator [Phycisphaerales bacterium]|nr:response regulator [Phycisphaerales bacterium]